MKFRFVDGSVALIVLALAIAPGLRAQTTNPPATASVSVTQPPPAAPSLTPAAPVPKYFQVPSGTRLPLVLHNAISTRSARPGDPVYLETLFPIVIDSHILIPAGSYVSGEVTEAKRPGRVHGRGEIKIKLDNLILPNGYQASFNASPTDAGTGGNEAVGKEGTIRGDSNKTGDAGTVLETTMAGAGLGGIAAQSARGAGIGAGAGAAAGLLAVLLTRGPEAELPRGTTLDVITNRPLYLLSSKANFTSPGQSSTLAGPPNREPQRRTGIIPY
jgi:type IV secretion system protein VirB10